MAILKHIASKNRHYDKALEYLMFRHNEYTQKPLRDERGNLMLRDEYYLEGLNCDPFSFSAECDQVNREFCKNYSDREIKSHHYIISFDPKDVTESGLSGEHAQELGIEFARKYFSGHQALVCTHTDGHNESGNIHVHIILNSVRKFDIEPTDFIERPCDSRAGFKHHVTDKLMDHMKETLMEICKREHLHQVDLLSPAADNVTEQEYWKEKRESERTETPFQTQKQFLRDAINEVASYANSPEEFGAELNKRYGITFRISRGRYSYLHPDRSKYITGRNLGDSYTEKYLIPLFEGNRSVGRTRENVIAMESEAGSKKPMLRSAPRQNATEYDPSYDYSKDPIAAFHFRTRLRLVVDLQECAKAQASHSYAHKVKITNLQQMARTICFLQEHGISSQPELQEMLKCQENSLSGMQRSDPSYAEFSRQLRELRIVCRNVDIILQPVNVQVQIKGKVQDL